MTARSRARLVMFNVANMVFGGLPRRAGYALGIGLARVLVALRPSLLDGLRGNLRQALPGLSAAALEHLARANLRNYAKFYVDLFKIRRLSAKTRDDLLAEIVGMNHLESVLARGKGCVVVSIHMGSWEGVASYWGGRPEPTALITEVLEPPALWEKVLRMRETTGLTIIPLTRSAPREILRRLKQNGLVAGAIDRDLVGNGQSIPFFGRAAAIPTGLIEIAQRTGAGLLPVVASREAGDRYRVEGFEPIWVGRGEGALHDATRRCLAVFEEQIRKRPDQWHVMSPLWPATATATVDVAHGYQEARLG